MTVCDSHPTQLVQTPAQHLPLEPSKAKVTLVLHTNTSNCEPVSIRPLHPGCIQQHTNFLFLSLLPFCFLTASMAAATLAAQVFGT